MGGSRCVTPDPASAGRSGGWQSAPPTPLTWPHPSGTGPGSGGWKLGEPATGAVTRSASYAVRLGSSGGETFTIAPTLGSAMRTSMT